MFTVLACSQSGRQNAGFMASSPSVDAAPTFNRTDITASRQNAITTAVANVSPAVVSISVTEVVQEGNRYSFDPFYGFFISPGRMREFKSLGTGFVISDDGLVVTNQHVIGTGATKILVTLPTGESHEAQLIGSDEYADLALLKIEAPDLKPIKFGNSDEAIVGEWCIALGNPFGLFEDGQPTVTVGVVSATMRDFRPDPKEPRAYLDMIQTDAAINSGNSGGPLVNSVGEVIGINTFIFNGTDRGGFVGLGFAIPANTASRIVNQLRESGKVSLPFDLGLQVSPISREVAYQYNLPTVQGVLAYSVNKDGPAFSAGILPGDVLVKIGEDRIYSETHYQALLREYQLGETLQLVLLRQGRLYETSLELRNKVLQSN